MTDLWIQPARSLQGELFLPGDKSISHRALLLSAISRGTTQIHHCLKSGDNESTRSALRALGIPVEGEWATVRVEGQGLHGLQPPASSLNMGNSGTTTRLLLGLLAGQPFSTALTGDPSLSQRPMRRVTEPLMKMGAVIQGADGGDRLPLTIRGGQLNGIRYTIPIPSAQVKSALLLAGLYAKGPTTIIEPIPTRDHTERMLKYLGAKIEVSSAIVVYPGELTAREFTVPGDISSAAFFLTAAAIIPGSSVTARSGGLNPTRTGFLDLLKQMGASIQVTPTPPGGWEPLGDVTLTHAPLRAIRMDAQVIPRVIDELPILMVAATQARGVTLIQGSGELRVKETDRIVSMVTGLSAMGAEIRAQGDEIRIEGPTSLKGTAVRSFNDHRTAMALAVAGLAAQGPTIIEGSEWIGISFPGFVESLESLRR